MDKGVMEKERVVPPTNKKILRNKQTIIISMWFHNKLKHERILRLFKQEKSRSMIS